MRAPGPELERLTQIMARLRAEGGCPWDREQNLASLRPYLIEEAYEVLDEMDRVSAGGPWQPLCEELGDLLFQIVFHAQLAAEQQAFGMAEVCQAIADKIESRHPHVFGEGKATSSSEVLANWAQLKAEEKKRKHGSEGSVLDGVPIDAPSLLRAERLTEKASRIGFDWPDLAGVRGKLEEELRELDEAIATGDRAAKEHELGDVLFSIANLARFLGTPAEDALRAASVRFTRRFHSIEAELRAGQIPFGKATLEQMEAAWQRAKVVEKSLPKPRQLARTGILQLTFEVPELAVAARFWEGVAPELGWRAHLRGEEHVQVEIGDLTLRFIEGPRSPAGRVSLSAGSKAAVSALERAALEAGATELRREEDTLTFRDPSGLEWIFAGFD